MSLANEHPIFPQGPPEKRFDASALYLIGRVKLSSLARLPLHLRNNNFPQCDENEALDTRDKLAFLLSKGREL
jgi:hypothetical protein